MHDDELIFEQSLLYNPGSDSDTNGKTARSSVTKLAPFLYKMDGAMLDDNAAEVFVRRYPDAISTVVGCSAIYKSGLMGHNFDAPYDDTVSFVVKTDARYGRHASIGIASVPKILTEELMGADITDEKAKEAVSVVPYFVVDGVNDAGVMVSMNMMPGADTGVASDDSGACAIFAVRRVLDYATSAQDAISVLENSNFWFPEGDSIKAGFYLLIADKNGVILSDLNGHQKILDSTEKPILTSFRSIGWDGTDSTLEPYANGIERYNILDSMYDSANTVDGMIELLKGVRYTGVYDQTKDIPWISDYNSDWSDIGFNDLTVGSNPADYVGVIDHFVQLFQARERDGKTKQTIHTAVYNLNDMSVSILVQEQNDINMVCMDNSFLIDAEVRRAKEAEQAIRDDFADTFASKEYAREQSSAAETAAKEYTDNGLANKLDKPTNNGKGSEEGDILYKTKGGSKWDKLPPLLPNVTEQDAGKVMFVNDEGKWAATDQFADYIKYVNITVQIVGNDGRMPAGGIIVAIHNNDNGDLVNQTDYEGQPVTLRVPRGLNYRITQTGTWDGYQNPTPQQITGAATVDTTVVFTYEAITVPETLRELAVIVKNGGAASMAEHIGLQFEDYFVEGGTRYDIIWDLKEVTEVEDESGAVHPGVILQWHYATPSMLPFDAPELVRVDLDESPIAQANVYYYGLQNGVYRPLEVQAGDTLPTTYDGIYKNEVYSADGLVLRRGYACYAESAVRKWLNSAEVAGGWFWSSHVGDVPPLMYNALDGFMHGCSAQILSMAKPVKVHTEWRGGHIDTYDTFFLPSVDNVCGNTNHNSDEGIPWHDWIDATGFTEPNNDPSDGRKAYLVNTLTPQEIGLRSANNAYQYITWMINTDGSIDGYAYASAERRYTPCCVIY